MNRQTHSGMLRKREISKPARGKALLKAAFSVRGACWHCEAGELVCAGSEPGIKVLALMHQATLTGMR